ncbi:MAG: hypothetical protein ABSA81_04760 [Candidatus Bathyarchaeia archaeon]|jgi:hypothetical protein
MLILGISFHASGELSAMQASNRYNYITATRRRVESSIVGKDERDKLVARAERVLGNEGLGWKASIDGFCMQLFTNSNHLDEFWRENWFSMPREVKSHGRLYAVLDPTFEEGKPQAFYNPDTKTAVIFNTEYYGQVKSWALGVACDIAEDQHDIHSIHGSCVEVDGKGVVLIAPTGTGKSTHSYALLNMEGARLHSDDWVYVRFIGGEKGRASADISERKFYIRTNIARVFPEIRPLLDRCKLENVIPLSSEEAEKLRSQGMSGDEIRILASDHYIAHEYSRAMLDPLWIAGPEKFVDTTRAMKVILLKRDKNDPEIARRLEIEEAVQYLVAQPEQFLNPYLIVKTDEKVEVRKRFFRRLFKLAPCYLVNTASDVKTVQQKIRDVISK